MRNPGLYLLYWGGVGVSGLLLHWLFSNFISMPVGTSITAALLITWLVPRPWRILLPLALVVEMVAVTRGGTITAGLLSPLLLFWLRGRIEVDLSFSFFLLLAASAALSLGIIVGITVAPHWLTIPWSRVLVGWLVITGAASAGSLLLPAFYTRFLHGRYF